MNAEAKEYYDRIIAEISKADKELGWDDYLQVLEKIVEFADKEFDDADFERAVQEDENEEDDDDE